MSPHTSHHHDLLDGAVVAIQRPDVVTLLEVFGIYLFALIRVEGMLGSGFDPLTPDDQVIS